MRKVSRKNVRKVQEDAIEGMSTAADSSVSHSICHIVPDDDRRRFLPIPAGMFAACHIQAMAEMNNDEDFQRVG